MKKDRSICEGNKRHLKYFSSKDTRPIGTSMMAASGVLFLWNWYVWYFYALYVCMLVLLPIGLALFIIGSIGRSTDEDIDRLLTHLLEETDAAQEQDTDFVRKHLKSPPSEIISGYEYSDGLMFKKGKNNVIRSSLYKRATLHPMESSIYVSCTTVNIPCEAVEKNIFELPYRDIEEIRVVSQRKVIRFLKKSFSVTDSRLEIISHGEVLLSLPAKESASLDSFLQAIRALKA